MTSKEGVPKREPYAQIYINKRIIFGELTTTPAPFDLLNEYQKGLAPQIVLAMSERYSVPIHTFGLLRVRFWVKNEVMNEKSTQEKFAVAYTEPHGLEAGSWNKIMKEEAEHTASIGGKIFDFRKGMTLETYRSLVAHAIVRNYELPDSKPLRIEGENEENTRVILTKTLLTGSATTGEGLAPAPYVRKDMIVLSGVPRKKKSASYRFRPAVLLPSQ